MPQPEHLFVYGTLRRGAGANRFLDGVAEYVQPALIQGDLYNLGGYPGLRHGEHTVHGDLYRILPSKEGEAFKTLDRYEGYREDSPENSLFIRDTTTLLDPDGLGVWVYYYARPPREMIHIIESGDWFSENKETHGQ